MDPSRPRWRSTDPTQCEEAQRYVITAKNVLAAGELECCWQSLFRPLALDAGAPGLDVLLVTAIALRAPQRACLPWGDPNLYSVLGLIPTVPTARDPVVIESRYRRASDLLNHCHPNAPCWPAFTEAAHAWDFLSDPDLKAFLDSGYEAAAPQPASPPPNQPSPPPNQPPPPPNQLALPPPPPNQPPPPSDTRPVKKLNL